MNIFEVNRTVFDSILEEMPSRFNTCFVSTYIPNPRLSKRIEVFKLHGEVNIVCSTREDFNLWEPKENSAHYEIIDVALPRSKSIVKRFLKSFLFQQRVYKYLCKIKPQVLYCAGFDSLSVAYRYCKHHDAYMIYEISDLREDFTTKPDNLLRLFVSRAIRYMDVIYVKKVWLLVVTSPQFYVKYYSKYIDRNKVLFIPNIPEERFFKTYCHKNRGGFTVGFIGGIRYYDQLQIMVDAVNIAGCKAFFAGGHFVADDENKLREYGKPYDSISFYGRYDYERDIAELYGMVDCVYAVYNADNENAQMALPNKLYEAIVCELPIIVAKGTYLAFVVERLEVGIAVNHLDEYELANAIVKLKEDTDYYGHFVENCRRVKYNADELLEGMKDRST